MSPDCPFRAPTKPPGSHCPICNTPGHTAHDCPQQATDGKVHCTLDQTKTSIVASTTAGDLVFVANGAHTTTAAPSAMEATQGVPAPSRLADPTPISLHAPHTPLRPQVFAWFLSSHPGPTFVFKLVQSLTDGFNIGYHGPHTHLIAPNLSSALQHPQVINEALNNEVAVISCWISNISLKLRRTPGL